jgi:ABC-type antimicrobial peptide transport system permease subunit
MGKTYSIIGAAIGLTFGILLIIGGIMMMRLQYNLKTIATITEAKCEQDVSHYQLLCNITIEYMVNNTKYTKDITNFASMNTINKGDMMTIYVDSKNPESFILEKTPLWIPILFFVVSGFIIIFSIIYLIFILRYKALAAISGLKKVIE